MIPPGRESQPQRFGCNLLFWSLFGITDLLTHFIEQKIPLFVVQFVVTTNKYGVNTPYSQGSTVWSKVNWTDK